jgi:hypothetical protein
VVTAAIIPNRYIVFVPPEADLKIMVFSNHTEQIFQNLIRFVFGQLDNALGESLISKFSHQVDIPVCDKKTFPSGDRICTNEGVNIDQIVLAVILRCATLRTKFLEPKLFSVVFEPCSVMYGSETFEEFLVVIAESIVGFICRTPESVASSRFGRCVDLQNRIIARNCFECDAIC